jgi:hypothetical protein
MGGDKVRLRDAVTVGKDQVIAVGLADGFIEDLALAKAVVFMPNVVNVQNATVPELINQRAGTIVRKSLSVWFS